jgi:hypothetical protein
VTAPGGDQHDRQHIRAVKQQNEREDHRRVHHRQKTGQDAQGSKAAVSKVELDQVPGDPQRPGTDEAEQELQKARHHHIERAQLDVVPLQGVRKLLRARLRVEDDVGAAGEREAAVGPIQGVFALGRIDRQRQEPDEHQHHADAELGEAAAHRRHRQRQPAPELDLADDADVDVLGVDAQGKQLALVAGAERDVVRPVTGVVAARRLSELAEAVD